MPTTETTPSFLQSDVLTQWQLSIARRADELRRDCKETRPDRDFWQEAEAEFLAAHSGPVKESDLPPGAGFRL